MTTKPRACSGERENRGRRKGNGTKMEEGNRIIQVSGKEKMRTKKKRENK